MSFTETILKTMTLLFPSGRASRIIDKSWKKSFYKGVSKSYDRAYRDSLSILDSILPDNDNFDELDASLWERRLGIFGNSGATLENRKAAILRKINHPGVARARQHYLYLQGELQKAGFDLYVHENTEPKNPAEVVGNAFRAVYSPDVQYGQIQYGTSNLKLIVNSVDPRVDATFVPPADGRGTFFIGGEILGDLADIPKERETELRQLILRVKPVQTIGIFLINFV